MDSLYYGKMYSQNISNVPNNKLLQKLTLLEMEDLGKLHKNLTH